MVILIDKMSPQLLDKKWLDSIFRFAPSYSICTPAYSLMDPVTEKLYADKTFEIDGDSIQIDQSQHVSKNLTLRAITKGYNVATKDIYFGICDKKSMKASENATIELVLPKSSRPGDTFVIKAEEYQYFLKIHDCK